MITKRLFTSLSFLLCLFLLFSPLAVRPARTQTAPKIYYVSTSGNDANDGRSWGSAFRTLQKPLTLGEINFQIWVAQGVYYPDEGPDQTNNDPNSTFRLLNKVAIYGGFRGTETALAQRSVLGNPTVLSGDIDQNDTTDGRGVVTDTLHINGRNAYHVVTGGRTGYTLDSSAVLDGFFITAGQADGGDPNQVGGGFYNVRGSPTLRNLVFSANLAQFGGGMYNEGLSSMEIARPSLFEVYFYNNLATGDPLASGGGMYNYNYAQPLLERVTFQGNGAVYGGGIDSEYQSHVGMKNVTFAQNQASEQGGAIYSWLSDITLTNATFAENSAPGENGADIFQDSGRLTLRNTILGSGCDLGEDAEISASFSIFQHPSSACGVADGENGNQVGVEAGLGVFGYHGGFTPLYTLQKDAVAIDGGTNEGCPSTDQRGFKRPVQGKAGGSPTCDIGALELYPYAVFLPLILR